MESCFWAWVCGFVIPNFFNWPRITSPVEHLGRQKRSYCAGVEWGGNRTRKKSSSVNEGWSSFCLVLRFGYLDAPEPDNE